MDIKGVARAVNSITYQTLFKYYPKLSGMTVRPSNESHHHFAFSSLCIPTYNLQSCLPGMACICALL